MSLINICGIANCESNYESKFSILTHLSLLLATRGLTTTLSQCVCRSKMPNGCYRTQYLVL